MHVVCAWIGNSERVVAKHYLQVTEEHFAQAAKTDSAPNSALHAKTSQNAAMHRARTEHAPNAKIPGESEGFCEIPDDLCGANCDPDGIR
jgi:hypothetical protein